MKQKLLVMLIALAALTPFGLSARDFAYTYEGQTITYTVLDEDAKTCATKAGYIDPKSGLTVAGNIISGSLTLPANPNDGDTEYSLVQLNEYSFYNCFQISSVTIPESVTEIGRYAFSNCSVLSSINILGSVKTIGNGAFSSCSTLVSINIPEGLTEIGQSAFSNCTSLISITIPEGLTEIGQSAFNNCTSLISITIPEGVTEIGSATFSMCGNLNSIKIPVSVITIGYSAFNSCYSLTSINIPENVTVIGSSAFNNCQKLSSINIPDGVTEIGQDAFSMCRDLKSVFFEGKINPVADPSSVFKNSNKGLKVYVPADAIEEFANFDGTAKVYATIASIGVEQNEVTVAAGASTVVPLIISPTENIDPNLDFNIEYSEAGIAIAVVKDNKLTVRGLKKGSVELTIIPAQSGAESVNIMATVDDATQSLGSGEFNYTYEGQTITYKILDETTRTCATKSDYFDWDLNLWMPGNFVSGTLILPANPKDGDSEYTLVRLERCSFVDCTELTSVTIPESVTSIESSAFEGCTRLSSIDIPSSVTSIERSAFEGCTRLSSIDIPSSVTSIERSAFKGCSSLTSVNISEGITEIGEQAFMDCIGLISINIPESVTVIGGGAFSGCSNLTSINIPESVSKIEGGTFGKCRSLVDIRIPDSVTEIGVSAFSGCSALTSINIPKLVTTINAQTFWECNSLTSVTLPESLTTIGESAFMFCRSLTSINIPESVSQIDYNAFAYCLSLQSIHIPDAVTSIAAWAFYQCNSLSFINIHDKVNSIGNGAFAFCYALTSVDIPDSVTSIGRSAFRYCTGLTSINIPTGITEIGQQTFWMCTSLTSLTIPETVIKLGEMAIADCSSLTSVFLEGTTNPVSKPSEVFRRSNPELKVYVPGEAIAEFANLEGIAKVYATITSFGVGDFDVEAGTEVSVPLLIAPVENTDSDFIAVSDDEETATVTIENGILSINGLKRGKTEVTITSAQPNLDPLVIPIYVAPSFDLDGSGSVNVGDVVNMVGKVITKTTDPERQDLTGDDRVDVSDIVRLVAHIIRGGLSKNTPSRSGALSEVPVWFDMNGGYTAMQTDVVVADGARIESVAINPAIARSHTLAYNEIEPGRYRVIVYSPGNRVMNVEADEPLFTLAVTGNDIVQTEATIFVEAEVVPTGIDSAAMDVDVESVTYFDLQGRRVSAEARGIIIERTVLTDGTIVNRKIRR